MTDSPPQERFAAARSGDKQALNDLVEPYRAELLVHCYRLLGSMQDAEDMVQETFLRAWDRLDQFVGGQYFRAWLYKIATNLCLDVLDKRARREISSAIFSASNPRGAVAPVITDPIWLDPFPDDRLPDAALSPEARYMQRESISLAFLAALQSLPPRQRAILILCDVLDWRAREVAQVLDITVAAVNGLLRRARSTMNHSYHKKEPVMSADTQLSAVLKRYVEAWESGDVDGLIALLTDKVIFTMPPSPAWYWGREAVRVHAQSMFSQRKYQRWCLQATQANNQIAFVCYRYDESDDLFYAHALQLLAFDNTQITDVHMFLLPAIIPYFGLPMTLTP